MTDDDLRARIAAAVARELVQQAQACGEYQTRDCYKVADAVIRELQMTEEVADSSQFHCTKRRARRYVTAWCAEWSADE